MNRYSIICEKKKRKKREKKRKERYVEDREKVVFSR